MSEQKFDYDPNDRVLAYHHGYIYEAKVLETKLTKQGQQRYKIHYMNWNKRWDEWVEPKRLLPLNESNLQIMQEHKQKIKDAQAAEKQKNAAAATTTTAHPQKRKHRSGNHPNKRRRIAMSSSPDVESGDDGSDKLEIDLPTELKKKLIRDWENITKHDKLMCIPRKEGETVKHILNDFKEYAIEQGHQKNIISEVVRGLEDYFNQALQVTLLYRYERPLHDAVVKAYPSHSMSQIYGVEHLCRLFVKLPQLLAPNDLDKHTRQVLQAKIQEMIDFLLDNADKYFVKEYEKGPPDELVAKSPKPQPSHKS